MTDLWISKSLLLRGKTAKMIAKPPPPNPWFYPFSSTTRPANGAEPDIDITSRFTILFQPIFNTISVTVAFLRQQCQPHLSNCCIIQTRVIRTRVFCAYFSLFKIPVFWWKIQRYPNAPALWERSHSFIPWLDVAIKKNGFWNENLSSVLLYIYVFCLFREYIGQSKLEYVCWRCATVRWLCTAAEWGENQIEHRKLAAPTKRVGQVKCQNEPLHTHSRWMQSAKGDLKMIF